MNGLPIWVKACAIVGFPALLSLYLLGAIPGLPSPILRLQHTLDSHAEETHEQTRTLRVICHRLSEGHPLQGLCGPVQ